jgi:hypothetical protein
MIDDLSDLSVDTDLSAELVVIGAGPAGIVTALEAAQHGIDVLLVESGKSGFDASIQALSDAATWDRANHAPVSIAVRRQVGGTSTIWGGRCVPYDPVDFRSRPITGSATWPVGYDEMHGYFRRASEWCKCGEPRFNADEIPGLSRPLVPGLIDGDVRTSDLERWSLPTDFGKVYQDLLNTSSHLRVITGVTCTAISSQAESGLAQLAAARTHAGAHLNLKAKAFVVACGGLESTRLLMDSEAPNGGQMGDGSGHLGRWYMAHLEGVIANVHFRTPPKSTVYGYERDVDGVYVRRRFTFAEEFQVQHGLPNMSGWFANPELANAEHRRGELSFVYLALTSPLGPKFAPDAQRLSLTGIEVPGTPYGHTAISPKRKHAQNVLRHPLRTTGFAVDFGSKRLLSRGRRAPGFFSYSSDNTYPFQYHGEHLPQPDSRVTRSREVDALGRHKLDIDLRFSDGDVDGVIRSHQYWDQHLRDCGVGEFRYLQDDLAGAVKARLGGGFHQVGTTRMATSESHGVVDANLAVHGVPNVYVASSSTFVTSGQANSTFMIVAFALRLADHLRAELRVGI